MSKKRSKTTYVAMSTLNREREGMNIIYGVGHDKEKVREAALSDISERMPTTFADLLERKNLVVVSKTKAKRLYGFDVERYGAPTMTTRQTNSKRIHFVLEKWLLGDSKEITLVLMKHGILQTTAHVFRTDDDVLYSPDLWYWGKGTWAERDAKSTTEKMSRHTRDIRIMAIGIYNHFANRL